MILGPVRCSVECLAVRRAAVSPRIAFRLQLGKWNGTKDVQLEHPQPEGSEAHKLRGRDPFPHPPFPDPFCLCDKGKGGPWEHCLHHLFCVRLKVGAAHSMSPEGSRTSQSTFLHSAPPLGRSGHRVVLHPSLLLSLADSQPLCCDELCLEPLTKEQTAFCLSGCRCRSPGRSARNAQMLCLVPWRRFCSRSSQR